MRRREFITLLAGAAMAWPLAGWAQPSVRVRRIGIFMNLASDDAEGQSRNAAFLQGLQELGWAVGRNVRIDYRWGASNSDPDRMRKDAAELLAFAPDVVLATTAPIVVALQQVSRTVPITFALSSTQWARAWSPAWRGRAATPLVLSRSPPASAPSGWSCSRRVCRA